MRSEAVPVIVNPPIALPAPWVDALAAVARDLACLQHGPEFRLSRVVWELTMFDNYTMGIGWTSPGSDHFWMRSTGASVDASFAEAAVSVADAAQDELTGGMPNVQWPSQGRHLLNPRVVGGAPSWVDPHGDVAVSNIGALCENGGTVRWRISAPIR